MNIEISPHLVQYSIIQNILLYASASHILKNMSTHIKNLLKPFIQSTADWKIKLLNQWDSIMGNLAQHATVEKIYQDTIIIGVYESCWLQELYLLSPTILHTINQHLDQPRLKQIRFKHTTRNTKAPLAKTKAKDWTNNKPITLNSMENSALDRIQDSSLKEALKSFLIRCHQERN